MSDADQAADGVGLQVGGDRRSDGGLADGRLGHGCGGGAHAIGLLGRVVDLVVGRVPGQGEEHLVEARLAIGELADLDAGVGERGDAPGWRRRCPPSRTRPARIGLEAHCRVERAGEDRLGVGPAPGVAQAHPQAPGADRRLQLAARALGDHLPVVDDRDPSASWSASSRYWVVSSTVVPALTSARTMSHTWLRLRGSSPVVGSSRKSTAEW